MYLLSWTLMFIFKDIGRIQQFRRRWNEKRENIRDMWQNRIRSKQAYVYQCKNIYFLRIHKQCSGLSLQTQNSGLGHSRVGWEGWGWGCIGCRNYSDPTGSTDKFQGNPQILQVFFISIEEGEAVDFLSWKKEQNKPVNSQLKYPIISFYECSYDWGTIF